MIADVIADARICVVGITSKTKWIFVALRSKSGIAGFGEATAHGLEDKIFGQFKEVAASFVKGREPRTLISLLKDQKLPDLCHAAIASALNQAAWDLVAKGEKTSVAAVLGGERHARVSCYANINRRTVDRSPRGFVDSADDAIDAGHEAIKIAPFDEATPEARKGGRLRAAVEPGLARMRAVRERIGPERRLMIDCHWRFDRAAAEYVIDAAAEARLYWVECPLPDDEDHIEDIKALRARANSRGVKLAGCETMIRLEGFAPFIGAGAYDVLMPDVKYVGGLDELLLVSQSAQRNGAAISPHNPTGPICHAASLQVCSVLERGALLESQFDESPLFNSLQASQLPPAVSGTFALPDGPGLGTELNVEAAKQNAVLDWSC